jgi:hypothetical protein
MDFGLASRKNSQRRLPSTYEHMNRTDFLTYFRPIITPERKRRLNQRGGNRDQESGSK